MHPHSHCQPCCVHTRPCNFPHTHSPLIGLFSLFSHSLSLKILHRIQVCLHTTTSRKTPVILTAANEYLQQPLSCFYISFNSENNHVRNRSAPFFIWTKGTEGFQPRYVELWRVDSSRPVLPSPARYPWCHHILLWFRAAFLSDERRKQFCWVKKVRSTEWPERCLVLKVGEGCYRNASWGTRGIFAYHALVKMRPLERFTVCRAFSPHYLMWVSRLASLGCILMDTCDYPQYYWVPFKPVETNELEAIKS